MTFDTNGDNKYLTWSKDDAVVYDAVFSSRTSEQAFTATAFNSREDAGRGSNALYITDFRGEVRGNLLIIMLLRGYLAGRYFEAGTITGNITKSKGLTIVDVLANNWSDSPLNVTVGWNADVSTSFGQAGGYKAFNDVQRNPGDRTNASMFGKLIVYWDPFADGVIEAKYSTENINLVDIGTDLSNPQRVQSNELDIIEYTAPGTYIKPGKIELDTKTYSLGDKKTGVFVISSTLDREPIEPNASELPEEVFESSFKVDTNKTTRPEYGYSIYEFLEAYKTMAASGYFGIGPKGVSQGTYDPTLTDVTSFLRGKSTNTTSSFPNTVNSSNRLTMFYQNNIFSFFIGHDGEINNTFPILYGTNNNTGSSNPVLPVIAFRKGYPERLVPNINTSMNIKANDYKVTLKTPNPKLSQFIVTVGEVKYEPLASVYPIDNAMVLGRNWTKGISDTVSEQFAVVDATISIPTLDYILTTSTTNVERKLTMNGRSYRRKVIIPLSLLMPFKKLDNGNYSNDSVNTAYFNESQFRTFLTENDKTESDVLSRFITPALAEEMVMVITKATLQYAWSHVYAEGVKFPSLQSDGHGDIYQLRRGIQSNKAVLQ